MASTWIGRKWMQAPQKVKVEFPTRVNQMIFRQFMGTYPNTFMIVIAFRQFLSLNSNIMTLSLLSSLQNKFRKRKRSTLSNVYCWLAPAPHNQEFSCCSWFFPLKTFIATISCDNSRHCIPHLFWLAGLCSILYHIHFHFLLHVILKLSIANSAILNTIS